MPLTILNDSEGLYITDIGKRQTYRAYKILLYPQMTPLLLRSIAYLYTLYEIPAPAIISLFVELRINCDGAQLVL